MSITPYGVFSGKWAIGSAPEYGSTYYLTSQLFGSPGNKLPFPVMASQNMGETESCTFYQTPDGIYIQLGNLMWLSWQTSSVLSLSSDFADASLCNIDLSSKQTLLEVKTKQGWEKLYYSLDNSSPLLSTNPSGDILEYFQLTGITPTLEKIYVEKGCPNGNFRHVNLATQNLSHLDFTGADFSEADLSECLFTGAELNKAILISANLTTINFDGATLDNTNMSSCCLVGTDWGQPTSAYGLNLSGCKASSAVLGHEGSTLNCNGAILTAGDFYQADLQGWVLEHSVLSDAVMIEANLDDVILNNSNIQNTLFTRASLQSAYLKNVTAYGANFIGANLNNATLNGGDFGGPERSFLFNIAGSYCSVLDDYRYPQEALITVFNDNGVTLSVDAPILIVEEGKEWLIGDEEPVFFLLFNSANKIDVFLQKDSLFMAAVFTGASCFGAMAEKANFTGANLQGVEWYGNNATFNNANLENADLSHALLVDTDFTKARLSGTNFNNATLIGAVMRGCIINVGDGKQSSSFQQSMLQGVNFEQSTLYSTLLTNSAISQAEGVLLFVLPRSAAEDLTPKNLLNLTPQFELVGNPISSASIITQVKQWIIDNSEDTSPNAPLAYRINEKLQVFDFSKAEYKFTLNANDEALLEFPKVSRPLQAIFQKKQCSVIFEANISHENYWSIDASPPDNFNGPVYYPNIKVVEENHQLSVYGVAIVYLTHIPQYPNGIAFGATKIEPAQLSNDCVGPSGYPQRLVENGLINWAEYLTKLNF